MIPLVYKFRAAIKAFPRDSWREFELLSNATLTQLAAAVMAAYEIRPRFDWYLEDDERRYELLIPYSDEFMRRGAEMRTTDPGVIQLEDLKFPRTKKKLTLHYNKKKAWDFTIQYLDKRPIGRMENSFTLPQFLNGAGGPHVDGINAEEARQIMTKQKAGSETDLALAFLAPPRVMDWRYDQFDRNRVRRGFRDACVRNEFAYRGYTPDVWYGYASPHAR